VDRIWTIRTDGTGKKLVHTRTMNNEIAGHEFFSPDGHTIWYDLQTPRGRSSGWPVTTSAAASAHGTRSIATSGRCITTSRTI
jgi:oligogalacturonide lyase